MSSLQLSLMKEAVGSPGGSGASPGAGKLSRPIVVVESRERRCLAVNSFAVWIMISHLRPHLLSEQCAADASQLALSQCPSVVCRRAIGVVAICSDC